ncbi:MAG: phosphopyruvate hydratase [Chloroflexi bacterium]|nr:phosphopyruvate hydratase [Chloroflexota bacterium]
MSNVVDIRARSILDSRGYPTVEAQVVVSGGVIGTAAVPSGASTGKHEAVELRDMDRDRYRGKGVEKAVSNVTGVLKDSILGMDIHDQAQIDHALILADGTSDKHRMGANALLAVSLACAHAAANCEQAPLYDYFGANDDKVLPVPFLNVLNGGRHASGASDIQEFMLVPAGFDCFSDALRCGVEIYHALGRLLEEKQLSTTVGDEGGFAPSLGSNRAALDLLMIAIEYAGYKPGDQVMLALDVAATELWSEKGYNLLVENTSLSGEQMVDMYQDWIKSYPLISIEDGLGEDAWEDWKLMNYRLGQLVQSVGDDLYTTNINRINKGVEAGASNAVLIKPNQIGTLTETFDAINLCNKANWAAMMSHRSGETEDTTIADLSVATGVGQIKAGAPARTERVAKYNRLLRIEEALGSSAIYAGMRAFKHL